MLNIQEGKKDENVHRYEVREENVKLYVKKDQRCIFRLANKDII